MRMEVQGRIMQARFIEIHQAFAKKIRSDTFLTMKIRREHYTAAGNQLTLLTGGKKFTRAYEGSRSYHARALH